MQPAQERFPFGQFPLLLIPAIPLVGSAVIGSPQVIAYPLEVRPGHSSCPGLAEHLVEFGVGPNLPDLLRTAAADGDLGRPRQRLLA